MILLIKIFEGWYLITCGINFSLLSLAFKVLLEWACLTLFILPTSFPTLYLHHGSSNFNVSESHLGELIKMQILGPPTWTSASVGLGAGVMEYTHLPSSLSITDALGILEKQSPIWTLYSSQTSLGFPKHVFCTFLLASVHAIPLTGIAFFSLSMPLSYPITLYLSFNPTFKFTSSVKSSLINLNWNDLSVFSELLLHLLSLKYIW